MRFVVYGRAFAKLRSGARTTDVTVLLLIRIAWLTLPLTAGSVAADTLQPWNSSTRITAEVLLWLLWAVVLVAVLAPRPVGLTAARTGAPLALAFVLVAALTGRSSLPATVVAIAATGLAAVLIGRPPFARACAQGAAYGDEERFPLKVPPALFLGVLPAAVLLVGAGIATGPLLIAAEEVVAGVLALVIGVPLAALLLRSLHLLARRWGVLVPAGFVVADPMTLTDAVLFPREHILGLGPADPRVRPPEDATDLRLGAAIGSLALLLDEDIDLYRRGRGAARGVRTHLLLFTPVASAELLRLAASRRITVRS
jgi:hypothetical protein